MNTVMNVTPIQSMSHIEIANLTGKRQDSVKRTMENLASSHVITFTQSVEKGNGRPLTMYHVNERDSYVVVAQLSPEFTAKLVDFWLQTKTPQYNLPKNYVEALEVLLATEREKEALQLTNQNQATLVNNKTIKSKSLSSWLKNHPEKVMMTKTINVYLQQEGYIEPASYGWTLTKKGIDTGLGNQVSAGCIQWVEDVQTLLPEEVYTVRDLKQFIR